MSKISNSYRVERKTFKNGERMPVLVRTSTGLPLLAPTYWIAASRRPSGWQPNTLYNDLRGLMFLYLWADISAVDIEARLRTGQLLSLPEIIDLVGFCGLSLDGILLTSDPDSKFLFGGQDWFEERRTPVGSSEKRNRISSIYSFIEFASADALSRLQSSPDDWSFYNGVREECLKHLRGYLKGLCPRNRDDGEARGGLSKEHTKRLLTVIHPECPENPFKNPIVRFRNYVLVLACLRLGARRGEMLGLLTSDCELGSVGTMRIERRPDNIEEKRRVAPATKTLARTLPLSPSLATIMHQWVVQYRSQIPGIRHLYLFVNTTDGAPLSISSVNKIFAALRKVDGMPQELSPHVLRHSWNDEFSGTMDDLKIPGEEEIRLRKKLMGWRSEKTATIYTRRTVERRANEVSLKMQERMEIKVRPEDQL